MAKKKAKKSTKRKIKPSLTFMTKEKLYGGYNPIVKFPGVGLNK